jgi:AcrR family transcriptional regulator
LAGYSAMTVEDIVVLAGVSRRTFYAHFKSKEDAFLAAYDAVVAQLTERVRAAYARTDTLTSRVIECVEAFLGFVAGEPAFADMCVVEVLAAGHEAVERRNRAMRAFAALIEQGTAEFLPERDRPPALTAETLVGGIYEVVYSRALQGRTAELPALLPDLVYAVLLPYAGADVALAEYERLRRERGAPAADQKHH